MASIQRRVAAAAVFAACLSACRPSYPTSTVAAPPSPSLIPAPTSAAPRPTARAQPTATLTVVGPELEQIPAGFNPLTGLAVPDPSLLRLPALLVSIPHFPPQARPQAGLSYAPWVFEYLISSGSTRLLAVFYGSYPTDETPTTGSCEVRFGPVLPKAPLVGNRVWLDSDADGIQDPGERGVGGVCIRLLDESGGRVLDETTSDSNGFYAFAVDPHGAYVLEFDPGTLKLSPSNMGSEEQDSDADERTGRTGRVSVASTNLAVDCGVHPAEMQNPPEQRIPDGQVGPVRSARLINIHIHDFFQDSCLIYAGSTREIRDQIPHCAEVFKEGDGGVGAMLDVSRLVVLAEKNGVNQGSDFNYSGNLFSEKAPPAGFPVERLDVYIAELNQSAWLYDAAAQGWLRYVDSVDPQTPGLLHPDTDRMTGRQLYFENIIVLYVEHEVLAPAIIDMYLQQGEEGQALLFRDGTMHRIRWSTRADTYEKRTGLRRPISFVDESGNAFPLRPGRSWLIVATPFSLLQDRAPGLLRLRIVAPEGAGNY